MTKPKNRKVKDSWLAVININVVEKRLLWLLGTTKQKWVSANRYKPGDLIRVTVEKIYD